MPCMGKIVSQGYLQKRMVTLAFLFVRGGSGV